MRIGHISSQRSYFVRPDRNPVAFLHGDDLSRTCHHRLVAIGNGNTSFQDDHRVVYGHCFFENLVWSITPESDSDRPAMALIEEVGGENVTVLSWRAFKCCISNGEFMNDHTLSP